MRSDFRTFRPQPVSGRVYVARRIVRSTDVAPSGRLRLDALARYLQTAAEDDLADSGITEPVAWVVRRCELRIRAFPIMGERLTVATFCSGTGPRWAERTTTLSGADGKPFVQASAVWTAVSAADGRPAPLSADFLAAYGESAGGRVVSARLSHPRPDSTTQSRAVHDGNGSGNASRPRGWPLRAVDFDIAGHVNNTVHWAVVEDELSARAWMPSAAEVEYHRAILPGCTPDLVTDRREGETVLWLLAGKQVLASARLSQ